MIGGKVVVNTVRQLALFDAIFYSRAIMSTMTKQIDEAREQLSKERRER